MEVDLKPLNDLIKNTFIEKNRCVRYNIMGKTQVNPFCKLFFILGAIFLPFHLYLKHTEMMDWINAAKIEKGEVDEDKYTSFTPYENFGVLILFIYTLLTSLLTFYILYVVMKECNCARISLVFWESPFWKYQGYLILVYLLFMLLSILLFHKYSRFLVTHLLQHNPISDTIYAAQSIYKRNSTGISSYDLV